MKPFPGLLLCSMLLLFGCHSRQSEPDAVAALSDTASIAGITGDSVKLVKTGSLNFKVRDIAQGARDVSGLVRQMGGMVFSQSLSYDEAGTKELPMDRDSLMVITVAMPQADMTVRVPAENLEAFMYRVNELGYFTGSSNIRIDDQSLRYLEHALKQKARADALSRPAARQDKSPADLQAIGVRDAMIEQQIANRAIDADAAYSTVSLHLTQNPLVRKEVIARYAVSDYRLPFGQRLGNAIGDGWDYFLAFLLGLAQLWPFIIAGLAAYSSYRYWQKRKGTGLHVKLK